jgi:hypothetical protein
MSFFIRLLIVSLTFIMLSGVSTWSADLTIPYLFKASTPAVANEVNANFSAVETAVDDNDTRINSLSSAKKFITLNPYGAHMNGDTSTTSGFGPFSGLQIPDTNSSFALGFVLPPDYVSGDPITVDIIWHTGSTNCGIVLAPNSIAVARIGQTHIMGKSATTGLTAIGDNTLTASATENQSELKSYAITAPDGTTLEAGDSIIFSLYRSYSSSSDTCADNLVIQGVSVRY